MANDLSTHVVGRGDNPALGILMMMTAIGVLSTMNVVVKHIGPDFHPMQVTFIRNFIATMIIVPFILRAGGREQHWARWSQLQPEPAGQQ